MVLNFEEGNDEYEIVEHGAAILLHEKYDS